MGEAVVPSGADVVAPSPPHAAGAGSNWMQCLHTESTPSHAQPSALPQMPSPAKKPQALHVLSSNPHAPEGLCSRCVATLGCLDNNNHNYDKGPLY